MYALGSESGAAAMANSEAGEALNGFVTAAAARARGEELKKELRRLAREISELEDCGVGGYEDAARALAVLRELRSRGSVSPKEALVSQRKAEEEFESSAVPKHFLCPISSELMRDPVILASGQVSAVLQSGFTELIDSGSAANEMLLACLFHICAIALFLFPFPLLSLAVFYLDFRDALLTYSLGRRIP